MAESHQEEIAKLEALYANNPEGRVFTHLAEAYRKAGELDRARAVLERGIPHHADYASAYVVLGCVLNDMGRADEARSTFRRVLELDRHNLIALRSLGELASSTGSTAEALTYYRELLSLDPGDDRLRLKVMGLEHQRSVTMPAEVELTPSPDPPPRESLPEPRAVGGQEDRSAPQPRPPVTRVVTHQPPADSPRVSEPARSRNDVVTETIAELYTAQGLHARAAEVYRTLLKEHPGDSQLQERLRWSEAAQAEANVAKVPRPPAEAVNPPRVEVHSDEGQNWLERVESAFTGGSGVAGGGPTPYAWTDPGGSEEADEGERISDYFSSLLAWSPRERVVGEPAALAAEEPAEEPGDFDLTAEDYADAADRDEPVEDYESGADDFDPDADEILAHEDASESDEVEEEDEDLEMFRSWLQSLKK